VRWFGDAHWSQNVTLLQFEVCLSSGMLLARVYIDISGGSHT
jgi:hypothetical protein